MTLQNNAISPLARKMKNFEVNEANLNMIKLLTSLGMEIKQVREYFGLNSWEWNTLIQTNEEIMEYAMRGKAEGVYYTAVKLSKHIKAGHYDAIKFFLETKGGYNKPDSKTIILQTKEETAPNLKPQITTSDPNEASRIYQKLMMVGKE